MADLLKYAINNINKIMIRYFADMIELNRKTISKREINEHI